MQEIRFVDTCRPLLLAVLPDRPLRDDEWVSYLQKADQCRRRWGAVIVVTDAAGTRHLPDARQRSLIAAEVQKGDRSNDRTSFAVMRSSVVRGIAKAIAWMSGHDREVVFTPSLEEALEQAIAYAQREGLRIHGDPHSLLEHGAARPKQATRRL